MVPNFYFIFIFLNLINALTWISWLCVERGKRGGLVGKGKGHAIEMLFPLKENWIFLKPCTQLFSLSKAHFLASIWSNKSSKAIPPSICLNYIIANEIYHFFHALPLKLAPTCFIKQCGTSRTQEFECRFVFWSTNYNVWNLGTFNILLKIPFQWYNTCPNTFKNYSCKRKKKKL